MKIGVIVALRSEVPSWLALPAAGGIGVSRVGGAEIGLRICGVGRRRARDATDRLCREWHPDRLLSLGFSGAVQDQVAVGDLVVATSVACGPDLLALPPGPWVDLASALPQPSRLHVGRLETFDRVVLDRRRVSEQTLAVDMESWAVVRTACDRGLPVAVVRAISDVVPARANVRSLAAWLHGLRADATVARERLALFASLYFAQEG